jgi:hypothetical protein
MEERSHKSLFATYITSLTPETPVLEPLGTYDPTEQLWRDNGQVVACDTGCLDECLTWFPTTY